MKEKDIKKLIKPEGQDTNVFNAFKRFLKITPQLTNEQLAMVSFETWDEAYNRSGKALDMALKGEIQ